MSSITGEKHQAMERLKHKFFGAAYSFIPEGIPVNEEDSWQRERKKTQSEISAVNMANAVRNVLEKKE